jgi:hypothetical protein
MADDAGGLPPGVDPKRANMARVYDYLLGGTHNYLPDQDLGRAIVAVEPNAQAGARANRAFLGRAVRYLCSAGISQFLDIGSGIPTQGNVHEVARAANPATRTAYVDVDPVAVAHGRALLAGQPGAVAVEGDLRAPEKILSDPAVAALLDPGQPTGLLLLAVLHFLGDDEDPWQLVAALRDALVPGSYLVVCHATDESRPTVAHAAEKVYNRSVPTRARTRSRADIARFFDGFDLVDPGLVYIPQWRPDSPDDVPGDPGRIWGLVGVGRKP